MTDHFFSLFDNYKTKVRNPFIGTILSVWILRNWIVVYALFTFDDDRSMQCKINYISDYFSNITFAKELFICLSLALLALIITFVLLGVSRLITDSYFKVAEPWIITLIDKKAILTSSDKEKLENRIVKLNEKLDKQNDALTKSENINELLQIKNKENQKDFDEKLISLSESAEKSFSLNMKISQQLKKTQHLREQYQNLFDRMATSDKNTLLQLHYHGKIEVNLNSSKTVVDFERLLDIGLVKFNAKKENFTLTESGIIFMNIYQYNSENLDTNDMLDEITLNEKVS